MEDEIPIVYSDSAYSVNTYNDWMFKWSQNNWKKADGNTPENLDLIREYYGLYQRGYRIDLQKVKGHAGNKWNEFVDKLAKGIDVFTDKPVRGKRREVGIIDE
jgi:ribonuclease HI